jgi:beta-glucosidase
MPSPKYMNAETLLPALAKGEITEKMLDDKVRHILRIFYRYGLIGPDRRYPRRSEYPLGPGPHNRPVALQIARESITLLKNEMNLLPLDASRVKRLLVCGRHARTFNGGGGSSAVHAERVVSTLDGLRQLLGDRVEIIHRDHAGLFQDDYDPEVVLTKGCFRCRDTRDWKTKPGLLAEFYKGEGIGEKPVFTTVVDQGVDWGNPHKWPAEVPDGVFTVHLIGSMTSHSQPVRLALRCTGKVRVWDHYHIHYRKNDSDPKVLDAWQDNENLFFTKVIDPHKNFRLEFCGVKGKARLQFGAEPRPWQQERSPDVPAVDAAIVCVFRDGQEGQDMSYAMSRDMDEMIRLVATHVPNTTVVIFAGSSVATANWIDEVPSVIMGYYPGQEGGLAVAEVLFGKVNPSGKLPFVWEKRVEDNPSHPYFQRIEEEGCPFHKVFYKEGIFLGYRGLERAGVEPLFPFGHGLSYTTFEYSDLTVRVKQTAPHPLVKVAFNVKNIGARAGAEAAQLYVGDVQPSVPRPVKELKAFNKVRLKPGESAKVELVLDNTAFHFWHPDTKQWTVEPGEFNIFVGSSSRDIRLKDNCRL